MRYWLLGAVLSTYGFLDLFDKLQLGAKLLPLVGATEILFGLWLTVGAMRAPRDASVSGPAAGA